MRKSLLSAVVVTVVCAVLFADQALAAVRICHSATTDVLADNTGAAPTAALFQKCIDDITITVMDLPPGIYRVETPIIVRRSDLTIRTAGLAGNTQGCQQLRSGSCATFQASAVASDPINNGTTENGILQAVRVKRVIFDHLIIDGNRNNRGGSQARANCAAGKNTYGFNSQMVNCGGTSTGERCEFTFNYTENTLCGTGLQWIGDFGRIQGNAAFNNGVHQTGLWSDGLTILSNNNGIINDNHLVNNTDVALIFGAARGSQIKSNWIEQRGVFAFAAMMLGNFTEGGGNGTGDYTGAQIDHNTIQCPGFWCDFGLNLGPDPWSPDAVDNKNVFGGTITQNNISGAKIQINFGGAGTSGNKATVTQNTLAGAPTVQMALGDNGQSGCKAAPNALMNLPNNNHDGQCGNWATVDSQVPTSANCLKHCF
jgi:hypothetical protein